MHAGPEQHMLAASTSDRWETPIARLVSSVVPSASGAVYLTMLCSRRSCLPSSPGWPANSRKEKGAVLSPTWWHWPSNWKKKNKYYVIKYWPLLIYGYNGRFINRRCHHITREVHVLWIFTINKNAESEKLPPTKTSFLAYVWSINCICLFGRLRVIGTVWGDYIIPGGNW